MICIYIHNMDIYIHIICTNHNKTGISHVLTVNYRRIISTKPYAQKGIDYDILANKAGDEGENNNDNHHICEWRYINDLQN